MHKTDLQTNGLMMMKLVWLLGCDHIVNSKRAFGMCFQAVPSAYRPAVRPSALIVHADLWMVVKLIWLLACGYPYGEQHGSI